MKIVAEKRLFWYLKDGQELDLENPSHLDMYLQQVLTHGKAADIKRLIKTLPPEAFLKSFARIKKYLPKEVREFWEEGLGSTGEHSTGHPHSS